MCHYLKLIHCCCIFIFCFINYTAMAVVQWMGCTDALFIYQGTSSYTWLFAKKQNKAWEVMVIIVGLMVGRTNDGFGWLIVGYFDLKHSDNSDDDKSNQNTRDDGCTKKTKYGKCMADVVGMSVSRPWRFYHQQIRWRYHYKVIIRKYHKNCRFDCDEIAS